MSIGVFVSSTQLDLKAERRAVEAAVHQIRETKYVGMEYFGSRDDTTLDASLDEVDRSTLYVGIFGFRYGSGITEREYRRARERGLPCFIFFQAESPVPADAEPDPRLVALKSELRERHYVREFTNPDHLATLVTDALYRWLIDERLTTPPEDAYRITAACAPTDGEERRNLLLLLGRVKQFWIEGVLEQSVHGTALIELGKQDEMEAVEHPWESILELPGKMGQLIPPEMRIGEIFERVGRSLLILGEPGSGKTITLLELARSLIARAERDPSQPVPVVFNLSAWRPSRNAPDDWERAEGTIAGWLVRELGERYFVPAKHARAWLENTRLLVLLDGLDEVALEHRPACVDAINRFAVEFGVPGLAACSRVAEYAALPSRLRLHGAIRLKPLTAEQIDRYLAAAGPRVAALRDALRTKPALQELAESPLMLSVMTLALQDRGVEALTAEVAAPLETIRGRLFDTYVARMFERKGTGPRPRHAERVKRWLAWIARGMRGHGQTQFAIDELEPSWLPSFFHVGLYVLLSRLIWGLVFGLALAIVWWAIGGMQLRFAEALATGIACGAAGGFGYALIDIVELKRRSPREASWVGWSVAVNLAIYVATGILIGGGVTLVLLAGLYAAAWMMAVYRDSPTQRTDIAGREILLGLGSFVEGLELAGASVVMGIPVALFGVVTGAVAGAIFDYLPADQVWLRVALLSLLLAPVLLALKPTQRGCVTGCMILLLTLFLSLLVIPALIIVWLAGGLTDGVRTGAFWGAAWGFIWGALVYLRIGTERALRSLTLRFCLYLSGAIPRDLRALLDYATQLVLLRKVGNSYIFIHRLLLEHFAAGETARG